MLGALRPAVDDAFPSSVGSGVERLLKWRMIFLRSNTRTRVYSSQSGGSVLSGSVSFVSSSFLATNSSASFAAAAAHVASVSSCSLLRPTNPPQMTLKRESEAGRKRCAPALQNPFRLEVGFGVEREHCLRSLRTRATSADPKPEASRHAPRDRPAPFRLVDSQLARRGAGMQRRAIV